MALNLFPEVKTPYYFFSYPWDEHSSGARCLHLLCHALNESGQRAYLVPVNTWFHTNRALNTPVLNEEHNALYANFGPEPIVIYPDIVEGNPFKSKKAVRWLLAPAGAYGGSKTFPDTDKVYGYTKDLAEKVLCLPTFDQRIFYPPKVENRSGDCFYAHKYDKIHGNKLLPLTDGMTRCEGTPEQVSDMLRSYKNCYVYERSEILINAKLCGCTIRPVLTNYWDGKLPEEFFDKDKNLVSQNVLLENFEKQLRIFIEDTQTWQ